MNIPSFHLNPAAVVGSVVAAIATILALLVGVSSLSPAVPHGGSSYQGSHFPILKNASVPNDAVKADAQKVEELLRAGLDGVTYRNQAIVVVDPAPSRRDPAYPLIISGSDGCNRFSGSGRINPDGTLEDKGDGTATLMACMFESGERAFKQVVRSGMVIYTAGDRVFLKRGHRALEFRKHTAS